LTKESKDRQKNRQANNDLGAHKREKPLQVIFAATLTRGRLKSQIKVSDGTKGTKERSSGASFNRKRERTLPIARHGCCAFR